MRAQQRKELRMRFEDCKHAGQGGRPWGGAHLEAEETMDQWVKMRVAAWARGQVPLYLDAVHAKRVWKAM